MSIKTVIASAGNTFLAALASLRSLGYVVTLDDDRRLCRAENSSCSYIAEDPLALLGLIKMHEVRGVAWQPTDSEVEACLAFDAERDNAGAIERVDVWEADGAVHMKCISAFGDPVELSAAEASAFAARLAQAILDAE